MKMFVVCLKFSFVINFIIISPPACSVINYCCEIYRWSVKGRLLFWMYPVRISTDISWLDVLNRFSLCPLIPVP